MNLIQKVTADPLQQQSIVLENGATVTFTMYFRPMQVGWFFNEIIYQDFILNGLRITNNPNMLYQFMNQIPFGLGCFSTADREPMLIDDFASGASQLYLLDEADCQLYLDFIRNG